MHMPLITDSMWGSPMQWIETKCYDCKLINVILTDAWRGLKVCAGDFSRAYCMPCERKTCHVVVKELHTLDEKVDAKRREYACAVNVGMTSEALRIRMKPRLENLVMELQYMEDELLKREITVKPIPQPPKPKDEVGSRFSGLILE